MSPWERLRAWASAKFAVRSTHYACDVALLRAQAQAAMWQAKAYHAELKVLEIKAAALRLDAIHMQWHEAAARQFITPLVPRADA